MDPEETWARMIARAETLMSTLEGAEADPESALASSLVHLHARELAEYTLALRDWVRKGGFVPRDFERPGLAVRAAKARKARKGG